MNKVKNSVELFKTTQDSTSPTGDGMALFKVTYIHFLLDKAD
jgi:hypothetical protein